MTTTNAMLPCAPRTQEAADGAVDEQGDQDVGKAKLHFGDAHDDGIQPTPDEAADKAERDPQRCRQKNTCEANPQ